MRDTTADRRKRSCGSARGRARISAVGAEISRQKSPRAKMQKPRTSIGASELAQLPDSVFATLRKNGSYRRGGERREEKTIGKRGRESGREKVCLISRGLSSVPDRPTDREETRVPLAATKGQVSFNYRKSNERPPHRADREGARSCASTIIVEIAENIGEVRRERGGEPSGTPREYTRERRS